MPARRSDDIQGQLPLTPSVYHILLALADGAKHGYAIMQEVESTTDGAVCMGPGTLYGSLDRMEEAGLVEESEKADALPQPGRKRRYYRLTHRGRKFVEAETQRMESAVRAARSKRFLSPA